MRSDTKLNAFHLCIILLLALCLGACQTTPKTAPPQVNNQLPQIAEHIRRLIINHPSLHNKRIQLVQNTPLNEWLSGSDMLSHLHQLIQREEMFGVEWELANPQQQCPARGPDYYLLLDLEAQKSELKATFLQGSNRSYLKPNLAVRLPLVLSTSEQQKLTSHTVKLDNKTDTYTIIDLHELSEALAVQLACQYQYGTENDLVFSVSSEDPFLQPVASQMLLELSQHRFSLNVGNKEQANANVLLALYPHRDSNKSLVKALVIDKQGRPLPELTAQVAIFKPTIKHIAPVSEPEVNKQSLIRHFFAVAPEKFSLCSELSPWRFGEQILADDLLLPHNGCFAVKFILNQEADYILLAQTAEGQLLDLLSGRCEVESAANRQVSYPPEYAKAQLILEADGVPGTEHFILLASGHGWGNKLERLLSQIPGTCEAPRQPAQGTLADIILQAKTSNIDIAQIQVRH